MGCGCGRSSSLKKTGSSVSRATRRKLTKPVGKGPAKRGRRRKK